MARLSQSPELRSLVIDLPFEEGSSSLDLPPSGFGALREVSLAFAGTLTCLRSCLSSCSRLTKLDLHARHDVIEEAFADSSWVCESLTCLEHISIAVTYRRDDDADFRATDVDVRSLAALEKLRSLTLSGLRFRDGQGAAGGIPAACMGSVRHLTLRNCRGTLQMPIRDAHNLESVLVVRSSRDDPLVVDVVVLNCPVLLEVQVQADGGRALLQRCPRLRKVEVDRSTFCCLSACPAITELWAGTVALPHLPSPDFPQGIRYLSVTAVSHGAATSAPLDSIPADTVLGAIRRMPLLEVLSFYESCFDLPLLEVAHPHLRDLSFSFCYFPHDCRLRLNCGRLHTVSFASVKDIEHMEVTCPNLTRLEVFACSTNLNDWAADFASKSPRPVQLDFCDCSPEVRL
mmetsp:Transcript_5350/g.9276  ORF Transcript_5350/g.9276 Transcript_5350/m.9276 type:complete len:402 (+) Transcript_5350:612-1817(+)|eukprot:CAMPEP_0196666416 /NCGR_PEP_ID=MMETSP1086-20130531/64502_1 /TAXON_ID=77921 /ORGANISM="Cyanoptyche  gloeocystis , Strain SAG4.97" /LENGTH=401 /DNA_ID=CAMNT_0042003605 /DNA_START=608 /DNA_END=1813 /DNA_ORIENTATION=-